MSENLNWIDRLRQSFENFEPKFETAYSHLDGRDAIANPILLHQKPLIIGQFGHLGMWWPLT